MPKNLRSVVVPLNVPRVERDRLPRLQVTSHCPCTVWRGRLVTRRASLAGRVVDAAATTMTPLPTARSEAMTRIGAGPPNAGAATSAATMTAKKKTVLPRAPTR